MEQDFEDRVAAMEQQLKEDREKNLMWVSNMAVHLVKLEQLLVKQDQRIEQNERILERIEAHLRNGGR